jgi:hypothetical protein
MKNKQAMQPFLEEKLDVVEVTMQPKEIKVITDVDSREAAMIRECLMKQHQTILSLIGEGMEH